MKKTPDFICIGMQKAGTTWLAANLGKHPSVWVPPIKEIHYFDEVHVDPDWYIRRQEASLNNLKRFEGKTNPSAKMVNEIAFWEHMGKRSISDSWYQNIWSFSGNGSEIIGEMTPDYSILPLAGVEHVYRLAPNAKILILLRDPIERTWSSARMFAKEQQIDPLKCFKEQFIIDRSRIIEMLDKWEKIYPQDSIFVGFYEDVADKPYELLESICKFIGVDFNEEYFQQATKKVHVGESADMPDIVLEHYKELFFDDISLASKRFNSYAATWYNNYY